MAAAEETREAEEAFDWLEAEPDWAEGEASSSESDGAGDEVAPTPDRWWRASGSLAVDTAFDFDDRRSGAFHGLAKLRAEGRLQLDARLPGGWRARLGGRAWYDGAYAIRGRGRYGSDVLDAYEVEHEVWESWIAGPLGDKVDLKAGRLITSLGTSETFRVVDSLFPIDNRVPGRADLEDLLLPLATVRLDVSLIEGVDLVALAFVERRFSEVPPPGSGWAPEGPAPPSVDEPGHRWSDGEFVLAARGSLGGIDLSLVGAWFYGDAPSWRLDPGAPFGLSREHDRLGMLAGTAVGAVGNFVWRAELAGLHGLEFARDPGEEHTRVDLLLGVDYFGLPGSAIAFDLVHRWVLDAPRGLSRGPDFQRRHRTDWAFRWRHDMMRDRLHLTLVAVGLGVDLRDGLITRLQADYAWNDHLTLSGGLLLYASGDLLPESVLGHNDRFFLKAQFRF